VVIAFFCHFFHSGLLSIEHNYGSKFIDFGFVSACLQPHHICILIGC
jgi:hypothetical protein